MPDDVIKENWIDSQLAYHQKAYERDAKEHNTDEKAARAMLVASILLFFLVLILEFFFTDFMTALVIETPLPGFFLHHEGQEFTVRSLLKIILGGVSAGAVFLDHYYGKLSLERKSTDHRKMALLYSAAKQQFEAGHTDHSKLFYNLACEEIIENGNWFSYCSENSPSFDV